MDKQELLQSWVDVKNNFWTWQNWLLSKNWLSQVAVLIPNDEKNERKQKIRVFISFEWKSIKLNFSHRFSGVLGCFFDQLSGQRLSNNFQKRYNTDSLFTIHSFFFFFFQLFAAVFCDGFLCFQSAWAIFLNGKLSGRNGTTYEWKMVSYNADQYSTGGNRHWKTRHFTLWFAEKLEVL